MVTKLYMCSSILSLLLKKSKMSERKLSLLLCTEMILPTWYDLICPLNEIQIAHLGGFFLGLRFTCMFSFV